MYFSSLIRDYWPCPVQVLSCLTMSTVRDTLLMHLLCCLHFSVLTSHGMQCSREGKHHVVLVFFFGGCGQSTPYIFQLSVEGCNVPGKENTVGKLSSCMTSLYSSLEVADRAFQTPSLLSAAQARLLHSSHWPPPLKGLLGIHSVLHAHRIIMWLKKAAMWI